MTTVIKKENIVPYICIQALTSEWPLEEDSRGVGLKLSSWTTPIWSNNFMDFTNRD